MSVKLLAGSDPEGLRGAVGRLRASAAALDGARRMLDVTAQGLLSGADPWLGWASSQFHTAWQEHSAALHGEVEALRAAAEALEQFAGDLEEARAVFQAARSAAAAADLTFDAATGRANLAPMIVSPDGAAALRAEREYDLRQVAGMVSLAVGEAVAADRRAAAKIQAATDLAAAVLLRGAGVAAGAWEGAAGGAAAWGLGLQRRAGVEAEQATGARSAMRAARGKPWQRGLIIDAMRARQEAELAGVTAQRYSSFANHPLFRVSRLAVRGGKALPVLAVAGGVLAYGENMAAGDTGGRAATRATVSTGFGVGAGLLAGAGVSWTAAALGIGLAGGPAGVAIAGAAIVAAVGAGWFAQRVGDDVGAALHDNVVAPVDRTLDRAGSAVKGAWKRIFG